MEKASSRMCGSGKLDDVEAYNGLLLMGHGLSVRYLFGCSVASVCTESEYDIADIGSGVGGSEAGGRIGVDDGSIAPRLASVPVQIKSYDPRQGELNLGLARPSSIFCVPGDRLIDGLMLSVKHIETLESITLGLFMISFTGSGRMLRTYFSLEGAVSRTM